MQMKIRANYHFTPTRTAKIQEITVTNVSEDMGKIATLPRRWECKTVRPVWKTVPPKVKPTVANRPEQFRS